MSDNLKVTCSVSQGSCLDPPLFLLYINDLPTATSFDTTLLADDTLLMMSDKSIEPRHTKYNLELKKIGAWLCQNKLLLNYPKTNFMVINNPHKSVSASFNLNLNDIALKRIENIKYPGISIDETLTWSFHITQMTLKLSRYAGVFCRWRCYVACKTLYMQYYTLVYSKIQNRIIVWATSNKTSLGVVKVKLNKILKIILSCSK